MKTREYAVMFYWTVALLIVLLVTCNNLYECLKPGKNKHSRLCSPLERKRKNGCFHKVSAVTWDSFISFFVVTSTTWHIVSSLMKAFRLFCFFVVRKCLILLEIEDICTIKVNSLILPLPLELCIHTHNFIMFLQQNTVQVMLFMHFWIVRKKVSFTIFSNK